jgi:hypothetical protein
MYVEEIYIHGVGLRVVAEIIGREVGRSGACARNPERGCGVCASRSNRRNRQIIHPNRLLYEFSSVVVFSYMLSLFVVDKPGCLAGLLSRCGLRACAELSHPLAQSVDAVADGVGSRICNNCADLHFLYAVFGVDGGR